MGFALALPACNRNNEKRDCHFFLFNIRYRATDVRTSGPYFVCRLTLMPHQILYFRRLKRKSYILGGGGSQPRTEMTPTTTFSKPKKTSGGGGG